MTQATIGSLRVRLGMDSVAFEKGIGEAQKKLNRFQKNMQNVGRKMQRIGAGMSLAITGPLAAIGVSSAKVAMDAEEMQSAFEVAFGESAKSVEAWAETTGNAMGRATQTLQGDALKFQTLLKNTLDPEQAEDFSKTLTVLAQDMQSFYNLSDGVATQKLFSGLTGESEPLKALGIIINETAVKAQALQMGFKAVNGQFSESEKVQARLAIIMQKTADAQGDVVRTSDSASNRIRAARESFKELQVVIGTQLIPAIVPLVEKLTQVIESFTNLSPRAQKFIVIAGGVFAAIGPIVGVVGTLVTAMGPLVGILGAVAGAASAGGLAGVLALLAPFAVAIGIATAAVLAAKAAFDIFVPLLGSARTAHENLYKIMGQGAGIRDKLQTATIGNIGAIKAETQAYLENAKAALAAQKAALEKQMQGAKTASYLNTGPLSGASRLAQAKLLKDAAKSMRAIKDMEADIAATENRLAEAVTRITPPVTNAVEVVSGGVVEAAKLATDAIDDIQAKVDTVTASTPDIPTDVATSVAATITGSGKDECCDHKAEIAGMEAFEIGERFDAANDGLEEIAETADFAGDALVDNFSRGIDAFGGLIDAFKSGDLAAIIGSIGGGEASSALASIGGEVAKLLGSDSKTGQAIGAGAGLLAGLFKKKNKEKPLGARIGSGAEIGRMNVSHHLSNMDGRIPNLAPAKSGEMAINVNPSPYFEVTVDSRAARVADPVSKVNSQAAIGKTQRISRMKQARRLG